MISGPAGSVFPMTEPPHHDLDVEGLNDRLALAYDDYYTKSPWPIQLVERRRLAIIRDFVGDANGLEVVEVGSGSGHVLHMFPSARLTAIDVSGVYLDIARSTLAGYDVRFVKGEIDKMDLPPASFDRVICTEVLEHVVHPDAVLAAMSRLLRPTGIAVVTVPNDLLISRAKSLSRRLPGRWLVGANLDWGGDEFHRHVWTPDEFEEILARHFRIVERRGAPLGAIALRACFKCIAKPQPRVGGHEAVENSTR